MKSEELDKLKEMAAHWHHRANCKFACATNYPEGDFGRRFIEHGATCYRNCAWELEREIKRLEVVTEHQCDDEASLLQTET